MAAQRSWTDHLVDVDWLVNAFDAGRPQIEEFEVTLDQTAGIITDYDTVGRCDRLHPRRQVSRMANRGVLGVPAGMDHAQDYFAGVDPDANLDSRAALPFEVLATIAERVTHRDRRVQRSLRMVLVRERGAKQREDAVAGRLDDV